MTKARERNRFCNRLLGSVDSDNRLLQSTPCLAADSMFLGIFEKLNYR